MCNSGIFCVTELLKAKSLALLHVTLPATQRRIFGMSKLIKSENMSCCLGCNATRYITSMVLRDTPSLGSAHYPSPCLTWNREFVVFVNARIQIPLFILRVQPLDHKVFGIQFHLKKDDIQFEIWLLLNHALNMSLTKITSIRRCFELVRKIFI